MPDGHKLAAVSLQFAGWAFAMFGVTAVSAACFAGLYTTASGEQVLHAPVDFGFTAMFLILIGMAVWLTGESMADDF